MRSKAILFLLYFFCKAGLPNEVYAQKGNYPVCRESLFSNSTKVSTRICLDSLGRFGIATAFNTKGKEIYSEKEIRFTKHAQTFFTYFPNGAVYKASYRVVREDGVHWTNTIHEFTSKGKLISIKEEGTEDRN
jgi:hypothetical protein